MKEKKPFPKLHKADRGLWAGESGCPMLGYDVPEIKAIVTIPGRPKPVNGYCGAMLFW